MEKTRRQKKPERREIGRVTLGETINMLNKVRKRVGSVRKTMRSNLPWDGQNGREIRSATLPFRFKFN